MTVEIEGEEKPALYAGWINYLYGKPVQNPASVWNDAVYTYSAISLFIFVQMLLKHIQMLYNHLSVRH